MAKIRTMSKGQIFSVTTEVDDTLLEKMRQSPDLASQAIMEGAKYFHSKLLPQHFKSGAFAKYGYARRGVKYVKSKRGIPNLISPPSSGHSGSMRRELLAMSSYRRTRGVELRMSARVLNLAPSMPQNSDDRVVKMPGKKGHVYPNMKREIKVVTPDEKKDIALVVRAKLNQLYAPAAANLPQVGASNSGVNP